MKSVGIGYRGGLKVCCSTKPSRMCHCFYSHTKLRIKKFFAIGKLAYGVKCAVAKHVRLASVSANTELKPVSTNSVVQARESLLLQLPLGAVMDPAASQSRQG